MPRNFDEKRAARAAQDRDFTIGGESFRVRASVRPEALAAYDDLDPAAPVREVLKIVDELLLAMIEDTEDGHARYRALRERDEDAVSVEDLQELAKWVIEVQTGRPTESPGGLPAGPVRTGTISTGVSSSPDTPAVQGA
jgi:hypothetical protein